MKSYITIFLFLFSISVMSSNTDKAIKIETKKEVITKKSKELTDVNSYIKSLKLKREKTIKC